MMNVQQTNNDRIRVVLNFKALKYKIQIFSDQIEAVSHYHDQQINLSHENYLAL